MSDVRSKQQHIAKLVWQNHIYKRHSGAKNPSIMHI